jgi:hypothetical protein
MIDTPILKHTLSHISGAIFLIAIVIYSWLLSTDHKQGFEHTNEEKFWIYLFLIILILGLIFSYYFIKTSNTRVLKLQEKFKDNVGPVFQSSQKFAHGQHLRFVGKKPLVRTRGIKKGPVKNTRRMV